MWRAILFTASLSLFLVPVARCDPPVADHAAWEEVDIVPMPKQIRFTGQRLPVREGVIVLGEKPNEQDEIGAKWINDKVTALGGSALKVVREGALPQDAGFRIFVGTRDTCRAVDAAAREGLFKLGPGMPGQRGYVLHPRKTERGTDLLLGGADGVGSLYACVTLGGLLQRDGEQVTIRIADIIDWPDYAAVTHGIQLQFPEYGEVGARLRWAGEPSEEQKEEFRHRAKEHLDRLLTHKYSCFKVDKQVIGPRYWRKLTPEVMALYKEITDYARARGIRSLVYALHPCVGLRSELPEVPQRCLTGIGRDDYEHYVRCWSMDEERRKNAARLGEFLRATGITDAGFHDWDTGGFLSPANWNERCEVCRKRWGDDFAAATINKHRIYYEEIRKAAPGCRLHFTLYPYNTSIFSQETAEKYHIERYGPGPSVPAVAQRLRERFTDFWVRCTEGLPDDATFCIRENIPENIRKFHETTAPHGTFAWYKSGSEQWQTFFDESPRWSGTFHSGRDDLLFNVSLETFVPLKAMAIREYTWNTEAPGATGWAQLPQEERQRHGEARGEIYEIVLPHIVRNFFGRRAATELVRAFSLNMAMNHIFDHLPSRKKQIPILTDYEKWKWQADLAAEGCGIVDGLFREFVESGDRLGMTPYATRRFIYVREVFHCCKWMAAAKARNMLARELAKDGNLTEAQEAIREGKEIIARAREDMGKLLAERPDDAVYSYIDRRGRPVLWKKYTPENGADFDVPAQMLVTTEKELPALAAAGDLPADAMETLAERRTIHVGPATRPPEIDGRVDEPAWRSAVPAEAFFAYPAGQGIARAHTRARFLRDNAKLYVSAESWAKKGETVMDNDRVELFLAPAHLKGGTIQFQFDASGRVESQKTSATSKDPEPGWKAADLEVANTRLPGRWTMEAAIPLATLGATEWKGRWDVNVRRITGGPESERSSIQQPSAKGFDDNSAFLRLSYEPAPALPPDVELSFPGVSWETKTLDDRVATVVDLGLDVRSSRVLHDVRVLAEAYDESGVLHRRSTLKELEHLPYVWKPAERYSVGFEHKITKGGLKVSLESDVASMERWIRIGGWKGTEKLGGMFSKPGEISKAGLGLEGPCYFTGEIVGTERKEPHRILGRRKGTVEFRFRPDWVAQHPLDARATRSPRRVLFHSGTLRKEHPENFNASSVTVFFQAGSDTLFFSITNGRYVQWQTSARMEDPAWMKPGWHHVACVWDHDAAPGHWLRLFVDGKLVGSETTINKPERLGDDKGVELDPTAYAVQLGSLNTGRCPGGALLDELRISRTARYVENFQPVSGPAVADGETTALFHFDGDLKGEGVTEKGGHYAIEGIAGVLEWH